MICVQQPTMSVPAYHGYESNDYETYHDGYANAYVPETFAYNTQDISQMLDAFTNSNVHHDFLASEPYMSPSDLAPQPTPESRSRSSNLSPASQATDPSLQGSIYSSNMSATQWAAPKGHGVDHITPTTIASLEEAASRSHRSELSSSGLLTATARRMTLESTPSIASLSLNSPRHSGSTDSSVSSLQNSPITPFSAYTENTFSTSLGPYEQYAPSAAGPSSQHQLHASSSSQSLQHHRHYPPQNALAMSVPAKSFEGHHYHHQGGEGHSDPSLKHLARSTSHLHGRQSSAGLLDQIAAARQAPSGHEGNAAGRHDEDDMHMSQSGPQRWRKGSREVRLSKSGGGLGITPPSTPARLSSSTKGSRAHSSMTPSSSNGAQRVSELNGGPLVRTPSKRGILVLDVSPPSTAGSTTPQRPASLRRATSDYSGRSTPKSARKGVSASYGADAQMDLSHLHSQQLAFLANNSMTSGSPGMQRTQSTPGTGVDMAAANRRTTNLMIQSITPSALTSSALQPTFSAPSHVSAPVSPFSDVMGALNKVADFLALQKNGQASANPVPANLALGTQEQLDFVDDIRRRIQARVAGVYMSPA